MLVNLKEILNAAKQGGYAVPAFNVYNMETVMGVIYAAERMHAPVIIQSYSRLFKEDTSFFIAPVVLAAANRARFRSAIIWITARLNWKQTVRCVSAAQVL